MDIEAKHKHLADTMAWIKANPKVLAQETWGRMTPCGTVACLAGHGVLRAGGKLRYTPGYNGVLAADEVYLDTLPPDIRDEVERYAFHRHDTDGTLMALVDVDVVARKLFGIDAGQANDMFASCNTLADLERFVDAVVNNKEWPEFGDDYEDDYDGE